MPTRDVDVRRVSLGAGAIALGVALAVLAVFLLLRAWGSPAGPDRARLPYQLSIDGPRLQSAPQIDLARYRAEQRRRLESIGWVDPQAGIVHIPIEAAMALVAKAATPPASGPAGLATTPAQAAASRASDAAAAGPAPASAAGAQTRGAAR